MKHKGQAKKPTEGIYRRLSKLLVLANDERIKDGQRANAKKLFAKLCKSYGIDPKCIREDGYNFSNQEVLEVRTDSKRFDSFLRVCCLLVGEFWPCQIRGRVLIRGNCVLDFTTEKPRRPDEAARSYRLIKAKLDEGWNRAQEAWKQEESQQSRHPKSSFESFFFHNLGRQRQPHKKSYVSGFFHAMKERLTKEQEYRRLHRRHLEPPEPVEPVALLPEPEPWVPPPYNPLAVAIRVKDKWCCPDAPIPNVKCPKCLEFDRYANRKVATARRAMQKREEPPPTPQQDAGMPEDPEYESQLNDDLEPQSYMNGQRAAHSIDINELKL